MTMKSKYVLTVDGIPPSNNKYLGKTEHYKKYQNEKKLWHWKIKASSKMKPDVPLKKAIVRITYFFQDEIRRDPDNYSGKFILDPLVKEGFIVDDSFDVVKLEIEKGGVDKENPHVMVEVINNEGTIQT